MPYACMWVCLCDFLLAVKFPRHSYDDQNTVHAICVCMLGLLVLFVSL